MTADNIAGVVLAVLLAGYLVAALAAPGEVLDVGSELGAVRRVRGAGLRRPRPALGWYMAKVYGDQDEIGERKLRATGCSCRSNACIYRMCRIDANSEQRWTTYAFSVHRVQHLQPSVAVRVVAIPGVLARSTRTTCRDRCAHLSWNTAVSFTTNTNWQSYAGEVTMSNLTQMLGLAVHNFTSAAVGMAVIAALIRGLARRRASTLGNFWVDLTRTMTRDPVPIAFVFALVLVSQGVIQNFHGNRTVTTVEGTEQVIPGGPVASHDRDQADRHQRRRLLQRELRRTRSRTAAPLNNFVEIYAIVALPFGFAFTFGRMVGDKRQGRAVFGASCSSIWAGMSLAAMGLEATATRGSTAAGATSRSPSTQSGGNMEGKEVRFGAVGVRDSGPASDDRHVERLGQLDARQLHAARRRRAARRT